MKVTKVLGALLFLSAACAGPALAQLTPEENAAFEQALEIIDEDPAGARRLIEPLANKGDAEALNFLATLMQYGGPDWEPDDDRATELREAAVKAGSEAAAMNIAIGLMMDEDADHARAVELLKMADTNEQLTVITAYPWGRAYLFGWGVPRDMEKGVAYLEAFLGKTHEDGDMQTDANYLVARGYQNGWGVPADESLAYRHMRKAAEGGDQRAQWHAAMMLLQGAGVEPNPEEAYRLVKLSSEQGYTAAIISRAVMLATGEGVAENDAEAREWYGAAAREGSAHALRSLGGMLARGEGGEAEPAMGLAMLELAAEAGDEIAPDMMERLASELRVSREAIDKARTSWLVRHGAPTGQ